VKLASFDESTSSDVTANTASVSDFVARSCALCSAFSGFSAGQKWPSYVGNIDVCWWLPFLNTYRTMCVSPDPPFKRILEEIRELRFAA
jgi:hypothetical protein